MRLWLKAPTSIAACLAIAACAPKSIQLPSDAAAYTQLAAATATTEGQVYRIGDGDGLKINVFQEPDLSLSDAVVDVNGNITVPLIGDIPAIGLTTAELAAELTGQLRRYVINPQVTVAITRSVAKRVFVEGDVNKAGVFPLEGKVTLLGALAMAEGTTEIADTRQVLVFRTVNGQRYGAKFDVDAIRGGAAEDPRITSQDVVVVGTSSRKEWVRNLIQLSPVLGSIFIALNQN